MKSKFFTTPFQSAYRKTTFQLAAVSLLLIIASQIIGVSDNFPGIACLYAGMICFVLIFTHAWRTAKPYFLLLIGSLFGFAVFAVLHNVFYGFQQMAGNIAIVPQVLEFLHVIFFLMALFLFPPGVLIGLIGGIVLQFLSTKRLQA